MQEPIAHLMRAFLVMNKDIDFIISKVSPSLIEFQCTIFVENQAKNGILTRS